MNEGKLLRDLGKYLELKGWKPLVIGFKGIAQREGKYNYSLIVDFTGKKNKCVIAEKPYSKDSTEVKT